MACIFMDGFDTYATADVNARWTSGASMSSIVSTPTRPLSRASISVTAANVDPLVKSFGTDYTQGVVGFGFYATNGMNSRGIMLAVLDGTTEQISIRTNSSSRLTVTRNGTVLATGSTVLSNSTWYYIELKFTIHNSSGVIELKLNGASEIASTGSLDTQNTGNTQWNGVQFAAKNVGSTAATYDDIYVLDPTTGTNTDFLGPVSVVALQPSAAGNAADWTPSSGTNHGAVAIQDGDTTFTESSTANDVDTFAYQHLPISAGSVYAVQHVLVSRDPGATGSIAPVCRQSSTNYAGSTQAVSSSWAYYTQIRDTDPATASAWTVSGVNSAEFGYKLI